MVIILVLLLTVAILSACISSSDNGDISIDSAVLSDVSVEYAATTIVKTQEIDDAVDRIIAGMVGQPLTDGRSKIKNGDTNAFKTFLCRLTFDVKCEAVCE